MTAVFYTLEKSYDKFWIYSTLNISTCSTSMWIYRSNSRNRVTKHWPVFAKDFWIGRWILNPRSLYVFLQISIPNHLWFSYHPYFPKFDTCLCVRFIIHLHRVWHYSCYRSYYIFEYSSLANTWNIWSFIFISHSFLRYFLLPFDPFYITPLIPSRNSFYSL